MKGTVEVRDGRYAIRGHITGAIDLSPLESAPRPVILNMSRVEGINSIGVQKFMKVLGTIAYDFELHDCSIPVIDMLNAIPGLLGDPPNPSLVRSLQFPYACDCGHDEVVILRFKKTPTQIPKIPPRTCSRCQQSMAPAVEPEDHFVFLLAND